MTSKDLLMARMGAAKDATQLTLVSFQGVEEPTVEAIKRHFDQLYGHILERILENSETATTATDNPFIMVYVDRKPDGKPPSNYVDFFERNGFKQSKKGGFYKRIRQKEYNGWIHEKKDGKFVNEWILNAFKVTTQIAEKQEEG